MKNILRRGIYRLRKEFFVKEFKKFDISSHVGSNGIGKGCKLSGLDRISIGKDCFFGEGTIMSALESHAGLTLHSNITISDHVRCIGGCRITCAGNIIIENDVLIGPEVFITDHNHGMDPSVKGGYSQQPLIIEDVVIEEGVWIGQRVCILPGVTIGKYSIIGANSVVTHDIPPYTIAVGAPAVVIKNWDINEHRWISINAIE